jgi:hypothetical protein
MVDRVAARLAGVERAVDSGCGAHHGAMGRKRELRGSSPWASDGIAGMERGRRWFGAR